MSSPAACWPSIPVFDSSLARASYSNLGCLVLGELIEVAGGTGSTDYVRENILGPLGMTATDFLYRGDMGSRAAVAYHPRYSISPRRRRWLLQQHARLPRAQLWLCRDGQQHQLEPHTARPSGGG
jgi:CubicO group peptidase (beta-lactamase class C family)